MQNFWRLSMAGMAAVVLTAALPDQQRSRQQGGSTRQPGGNQQQRTAAAQPIKVDLDQLEDHPEKFVGQTVTVEGEVDRVLGPHLFTVDEKDWVDLEREMAVVVPEPFAAIVKSDMPVRITGVVQKVPIAKIEQSQGFLSNEPKLKAEIENEPVLLATEVTTITPAVVSLRVRTDQPVGTSGGASSGPITDANQLAAATNNNMVGRKVDLRNVTVAGVNPEGFWVQTPSGERIFVKPATTASVKQGQTANVQGVVLELPEGIRVKVNGGKEAIYIYAENVTAR
jgi:hypothetical protein